MVTWIQSLFWFPSQAVTKTEHPRSKTPDTRLLLSINVGFTKSVLKSLNLIFSRVNFVYKIRK